jgi:hypothetical protein
LARNTNPALISRLGIFPQEFFRIQETLNGWLAEIGGGEHF